MSLVLENRQDVIIWNISGSCLWLCLLFCFCAFLLLHYYDCGLYVISLCTPSWHLSLIGASWCEPVMSVNKRETKGPQHKDLKNLYTELLMIAVVSFRRRRARRRTHRDLERSDHSSLWGLLVCWLCTRWHFSLRRETRRTAQLGSACLRAGQAIRAHFVVEESIMKTTPGLPILSSWLRTCFHWQLWFVVFHSYLAFKVL